IHRCHAFRSPAIWSNVLQPTRPLAPPTQTRPGPLLPGPGDATGLGMKDGSPADVTAPQGPGITGTAGPGPCHAIAGMNSASRRRRLTATLTAGSVAGASKSHTKGAGGV